MFLPLVPTLQSENKLTRIEELSLIKRLKTANRQKYGKRVADVQIKKKEQEEEPQFSDMSDNEETKGLSKKKLTRDKIRALS
jgi:hypothetical protein